MSLIGDDCFVIYQGHHGDAAANRADVILPEAAYTEQDAIFVNMEGRPQYARRAVPPVGEAKDGWWIISGIAKGLKMDFGFEDLASLRAALAEEYPVFANIDQVAKGKSLPQKTSAKSQKEGLKKEALKKIAKNYYMTDQISRASVTMAKCAAAQKQEGQK